MLRSYLKLAFRNFIKYKGYSSINIIGLAVGVAACVLITLFVLDELSYDSFYSKASRIFRVTYRLELNGQTYNEASAPFPMMPALLNDFPEVEDGFRLYQSGDFPMLEFEGEKFIEERFFFADQAIFKVLDLEFINGHPESALTQPSSLVLTEEAAKKYFGEAENAVGKTLSFEGRHSLQVSAVVKSLPRNSHFRFEMLAPLELQLGIWASITGDGGREKKWIWTGAWHYLLLSEQQPATELKDRLTRFVDAYFPDRLKQGISLSLQPITDIHLHSRLGNEISPNSHIAYVYIFSAIAALILILGCVNFMNLASAQSIHRVHEVGVRKALGGHQRQLARQLLGETFLMCLLAFLVGLLLSELFLTTFNDFTGKALSLSLVADWSSVAIALAVVLVIGILSGLYPAVFLSKFETAAILRGAWKLGSGSDLLRKALVIAQFAVSIALAIGVGIVYQQLRFVQETQLGFEKEGVVFIKPRPSAKVTFETIRNELLLNPQIKMVSASSNIPGRGASIFRFLPEGTRSDEPVALPLMLIEHDFLQTLGISVRQGRGLHRRYPSDKDEAFLLNERAAKELGWDQDALGKTMQLFAPGSNNIAMSGQVIGVIEDYHFESLHHVVKPLVLAYFSRNAYYAVKLDVRNLPGAIAHIEKTWSALVPEWPLELLFLDEDLGKQYRSDQQLEIVVRVFAILALSIACSGLFGLGSFMILRRTKEIGIRKIVGADSSSIWWMIARDFTKLVLVANLIAAPLAYFTTGWWLQNFAYRATIDWKIFLLCGITGILAAQLTTGYHTIKAAILRPVDLIKQD